MYIYNFTVGIEFTMVLYVIQLNLLTMTLQNVNEMIIKKTMKFGHYLFKKFTIKTC